MSTFLTIMLILALIAGMMSRTKPTIIVPNDYGSHKKKIQLTDLSDDELISFIKSINVKKGIESNNDRKKIIKLIQIYIDKFGYDSDFLSIYNVLIIELSERKYFEEAMELVNMLLAVEKKWGFYFKGVVCWKMGDIREGSRFFLLSSECPGMDKNFINSKKMELLPYVNGNFGGDKEQIEIEKRGYGRFIIV